MTANAIQAVIFDFDGVLAESVEVKTQAFSELYADHGPVIVANVVRHHLAHGGMSRFDKILHYHEVFLKRPLGEDERRRLLERFAHLVEDAVVEAGWVDGARDCLERHKGKIPLFIVSGTPQLELERIVTRRGMSDYFASIHGSPVSKSTHLRTIIGKYDFDPRHCVMVGDATTDLNAALETGMNFIGRVPPGHRNPFPDTVTVQPDLTELTFLNDAT